MNCNNIVKILNWRNIMKKVAVSLIALTVMSSSLLVTPLNSYAAEKGTTSNVELSDDYYPVISDTEKYSIDISPEQYQQDLEGLDIYSVYEPEASDLIKTPSTSKNFNDGMKPTMVIDEGGYNWTYLETTYGSDVLINKTYSFLLNAAIAGTAATIVGKIGTAFWSGIAGYQLGKVTFAEPKSYWWKVKKYQDKDSMNYYTKYNVSMYSNSARTKLVDSFTTAHTARYK